MTLIALSGNYWCGYVTISVAVFALGLGSGINGSLLNVTVD